jgi:hypothetical protein
LDAYSRSIHVEYSLDHTSATIAENIRRSFEKIMRCAGLWSVKAKTGTQDWKRNAGATNLQSRRSLTLDFARPGCLRIAAAFPRLRGAGEDLYFLPDAVIVLSRGSAAALAYKDICLSAQEIRFIEDDVPPRDATVVGHTWRYVNKNGGPDRRFNLNKELPICLYGELHFSSIGGLSCMMQCSNSAAMQEFCSVIDKLQHSDLALPKAFSKIHIAKKWPSVAFLSVFSMIVFGLSAFAIAFWQIPFGPMAHQTTGLVSLPLASPVPLARPVAGSPPSTPRRPEPTRGTGPNSRSQQTPEQIPAASPQQNKASPFSFSECFRIEDINLRADCLEEVHARGTAPVR